MRICIANKIMASVNTPRESAYSEQQHVTALRRYKRTRSSHEAEALWAELMALRKQSMSELAG